METLALMRIDAVEFLFGVDQQVVTEGVIMRNMSEMGLIPSRSTMTV